MSSLFRRLYPYLLITLFALPALWPLGWPGLPRANDHLPHFFRVVALDARVQAGELLPRWSPDLALGYGYPVFNYHPPLGHALAEVLHLLGFDFLTAFKLACALAVLMAGWFAYQWARDLFGEWPGLLAGVAYLYSPYLLYDTYIRGSLPETLALALVPLAARYLRRTALGDRRAAVWAGLALAAFMLSHHGVALQTMPLLLLYALWIAFTQRRLSAVALPIAAFVLSALLSAFFWMPALLEARFVQVERGTAVYEFSYAANFLSWPELLAQPRWPVDPALLNPPVVRALPVVALGIAALSLLRWRALQPIASARVALALLTLVGLILVLPVGRPVWERVPLLQMTLFPWRLLGPLSLFIALLAGSAFWQINLHRWRLALPLAAMGLMLSAGLPFATPPTEAAPAAPTLSDVAAFEIPPLFIGTTTVGEYLPVWVKQLPDLSFDREQLMRGETPLRYDAPGAEVRALMQRGLGHTFVVTATAPLAFTYRQFYFPGWQAAMDGQPVALRITDPEGLMRVALPAGTHTLAFRFGLTPPRAVGNALSWLGAAGVFVLWLGYRPTLKRRAETTKPAEAGWPDATGIGVLAFGILCALARPWLYDAGLTPLLQRRLQADGLRNVAHPLNADVAGELTLLGWEADRETLSADEAVTASLYWKANHPLGVAYGFDARLVDAAGFTWSEANPPRPRNWRFTPGTDQWPADQYILDPYILTPLAGTPPGDYSVRVTVFALHNLQTIGVIEAGQLTITAPSRRACATQPVGRLADLTLQSAEFSLAHAAPGDVVNVSLCWAVPAASATAALQLTNEAGQVMAEHPLTLTAETARQQFAVPLTATLPTGQYQWQLTHAEQSLIVGALHITAPERQFEAPPVAQNLAADLGPVSVYGVTAPARTAPGQSLPLTLVWRANAFLPQSYRVFVHLMDAEGNLRAQSDGVPANWTRPTSGWLPGEFVADTRALALPADLPPGTYTLFAGMYSGAERLTSSQFPDGRVPLGSVIIAPQ